MNRDEYKVKLQAYFLLNGHILPEWASWIAVDYDLEVVVFSRKPAMERDICWARVTDYRGLKFGEVKYLEWVDFDIDPKESLISIEELFDD